MHNEIFTIGKVTIHGYGLMIGIGFLAAVLLGMYRAKKKGLNQEAILDIAKQGLESRGFGEEALLEPLYKRAELLASPARTMLDGVENGKTIEHYIKEYAQV